MNEPDPVDAAFQELLSVRAATCLIVAAWPGQPESEPYPAPPHIKQQMLAGRTFPFVREASPQELQDYALDNDLFSPQMTKYLTKDWGSW